MDKNKVITYSLLAHINNNKTLSRGLLVLFIPIVKRALAVLNSEGVSSGKSISEIKDKIESIHSLNMPIPVLKNILEKISDEVNTDEQTKFILYGDGAFTIKDFLFLDYEEVIKEKEKEIDEIEMLFKGFCEANKITENVYCSVFDFIEKNKLSLSKYLGGTKSPENSQESFLIESHFVEYFKKIPAVYSIIRNIYLGSIISTYIEFKTECKLSDIELVFDTNFIIGLHDLNTTESNYTCNQLIEISKQFGFKLSVLDITINEVQNLLKARSENFDHVFLQRKINPEDIYSACDRRKLNKTDLQRFSDNIEEFLKNKGFHIIDNTKKFQNKAKYSNEYINLKKIRHSDFAALHDATAIYYVREKRGKNIYDFEDVKCWFVHNSIHGESDITTVQTESKKLQPEVIKVDDLLNILWLSNPGANNINEKDLTDFGLNSLISCTLSDALPKAQLIRELDENIEKYIKDNSLNEKDIIRVATRISNRELRDIEGLNKLERESPSEFIKKIKAESDAQEKQEKERAKKLEEIISNFQKEIKNYFDQKKSVIKKLEINEKEIIDAKNDIRDKEAKISNLYGTIKSERVQRLKLENEKREIKQQIFYESELKKWRKKSWREFFIFILLFIASTITIFSIADWSLFTAQILFSEMKGNIICTSIFSFITFIFSSIIVKTLFYKYRIQSNINAYKESLKLPDDLKELKSIEEL